MLPSDRLRVALLGVARQRMRFALTFAGIALGAAMLTVSLSVGLGVRAVVLEHLRAEEMLRRVEVYPGGELRDGKPPSDAPASVLDVAGDMPDAKRARLREAQLQRWRTGVSFHPVTPLSPALMEAVRTWPGVESVTPVTVETARLALGGRTIDAAVMAVPAGDARLAGRVEFGTNVPESPAVVLSEFALHRLGVRDDAAVPGVLGTPVTLEFANDPQTAPSRLLRWFQADASGLSADDLLALAKFRDQLPLAVERLDLTPSERDRLRAAFARRAPGQRTLEGRVHRESLPLVGVIRLTTAAERKKARFFEAALAGIDAFVPLPVGERVSAALPRRAADGHDRLQVQVSDESRLKEIDGRLKDLGVQTFSLGDFVEQLRANTALVVFGMNFLAWVALLVAALGVASAQVASVIERTREVGVWKATGASDGAVLSVFLLEGAALGLAGGIAGVLAGVLLSLPGERIAQSMVLETAPELKGATFFRFPAWLVLGVVALTAAVAVAACWLPARRAARIDPVRALRGE